MKKLHVIIIFIYFFNHNYSLSFSLVQKRRRKRSKNTQNLTIYYFRTFSSRSPLLPSPPTKILRQSSLFSFTYICLWNGTNTDSNSHTHTLSRKALALKCIFRPVSLTHSQMHFSASPCVQQ
jgi:hypothetical protein